MRGGEFKGGSLHDGFGGFDGLAVLEITLPSFASPAKYSAKTVLAVSAVVAISVVTATPLKLKPPSP